MEERQWVGKAQGIDVFKNLSRGVRGSVPKAPPPSSLYVSKKGCGGENKKNGRKLGRGGEKDVFKLTFLCSGLMGYGSSFILHIREKVTWQNCPHMLINF